MEYILQYILLSYYVYCLYKNYIQDILFGIFALFRTSVNGLESTSIINASSYILCYLKHKHKHNIIFCYKDVINFDIYVSFISEILVFSKALLNLL